MTASVGAALGLARVADEVGLTVEVFGTPAEEGGGGKIEMLERGAFRGLDLVMMAHPAPVDVAEAQAIRRLTSEITFTGKAAHAAAYPEHGRMPSIPSLHFAQVALGLLRQQLPATVRVHGVMTGGEAPPMRYPSGPAADGMSEPSLWPELADPGAAGYGAVSSRSTGQRMRSCRYVRKASHDAGFALMKKLWRPATQRRGAGPQLHLKRTGQPDEPYIDGHGQHLRLSSDPPYIGIGSAAGIKPSAGIRRPLRRTASRARSMTVPSRWLDRARSIRRTARR